MACRPCAETGHIKPECVIADLAEIPNWQAFVQNGGTSIPQIPPPMPCTNYKLGNNNINYNLQ